jgi:polysaccharide biosynthesis transport protein
MPMRDPRLVSLGYGKFSKADRICALAPIDPKDRGQGRRTYVYVDGMAEPIVASRSERAITADIEAALTDAAQTEAGRTPPPEANGREKPVQPAPMSPSDTPDGPSFNVAEIPSILWRRRISFLVTFAICVAVSAVVTYSLPKVYSTDAVMLVRSGAGGPEIDDAETSDLLTKTYAELLQTDAVADAVADRLPFSMDGDAVEDAVKISPLSGSQLLRVEAEARDPERAETLANTFARVFKAKAAGLASRAGRPARISIAETASRPASPSRPKPALYLLVGVTLAALLSAGVALFRDRLEDRVRIDPATTRVLGLPVIGRIPEMGFSPLSAIESEAAWTLSSEPWRYLLANLGFATSAANLGTLAIVSAEAREGKSSCAISLAHAATEREISTLLVDADMRLGTVSTYFADHNGSGLSTLLAQPGRVIRSRVNVSGTTIQAIPSGPIPENPSGLLSSENLAKFNRRAANRFDLVIYDTPPLRAGADASLIAAKVDGVVLVIDAVRTRRPAAVRAIDQLKRARANVLGVVLNRVSGAADQRNAHHGRTPSGESAEGAPAGKSPSA